ncbi:hypothetical protein [Bordetella tumulicola]
MLTIATMDKANLKNIFAVVRVPALRPKHLAACAVDVITVSS